MGTEGLVSSVSPWMIPQAVPAQGLQVVGLLIKIYLDGLERLKIQQV